MSSRTPKLCWDINPHFVHTIEIDGNNLDEIESAFEAAKACKGKPTAIVAKTVKGKGVSFMENKVDWHGKAPKDLEYNQAIETR